MHCRRRKLLIFCGSQSNFKAEKYTGKKTVEDRKQADLKLLQGELSVLVVTESFELGVDNPI